MMAGMFLYNVKDGNEKEIHDHNFEKDFSKSEVHHNEDKNTPLLVATYSGNDLKIDSELVTAGLAAIAIKHIPQALRLSKGYSLSDTHCGPNHFSHQLCNIPGSIQPRSSFYDLHHPELMNLKWAKKLPPENRKEAIERFFHQHATRHGLFCQSLHSSSSSVSPSLHQHEFIIHGDSITSCSDAKTLGFSRTKEMHSAKFEKGQLETIMAPITGQDCNLESMMHEKKYLEEAASFESDELQDISDTKKGTGAGEFEMSHMPYCVVDEEYKVNDEERQEVLQVQGESGSMTCTQCMNDGGLGILNLLHRSPARMNLATLDMASSMQGSEIEIKNTI